MRLPYATSKAMAEATLSAKNQIVLPQEAREALGLKPGDKALFIVRSGRVFVLRRPKSYRAAIRGLAHTAYPTTYLQKERQSWD
jgi:AbrB family looped-hinge helix DNA binding protein